MALASSISISPLASSNPYYTPSGDWAANVFIASNTSSDGYFQGYCLNWGGFDSQNAHIPVVNVGYAGYTSNWGGKETPAMLNTFSNQPYVGYTSNISGGETLEGPSITNNDLDSVIDYPKLQTIYYKLRGWNSTTSSFESWVISENITGRPELFDPEREPPNVERDLFKTPPSGNSLVDIIIVSRWIE